MAKTLLKKVGLYYGTDNPRAADWERKIRAWIRRHYPAVHIVDKGYDVLVVLGGDGTILEAARECQSTGALIVGLNLGTVGFLASARRMPQFLPTLKKLFSGKFQITERSALTCAVVRNKKIVFETIAVNELVIMNPLGMVAIQVYINGHEFQYIAGTGAMVATSTGSTAYNISAHGPVVTPGSESFILTELLDHNIPTPSLVLNDKYKIELRIKDFRRRELLSITKGGHKVDVLFIADGEILFPLKQKDVVRLERAPYKVRFAEFEKNYFLKSLQEKFGFK
jgi:NAD+ kinase